MEKITYREYLIWSAWFREQWNSPDRTDHYLMQVSQRLLQVNSKNPGNYLLGKEKISFTFEKPEDSSTIEVKTKEQIHEESQQALAVWAARLGIKIVNPG